MKMLQLLHFSMLKYVDSIIEDTFICTFFIY